MDRIFDRVMDQVDAAGSSGNYPPYNIAQINEDEYMISLAVAGFGMDNLDITKNGTLLIIDGTSPKGDEDVEYLHKGIAARNFRREFTLAAHVEVEHANLELGMLNIHLKREVPEELLPKRIDITQKD